MLTLALALSLTAAPPQKSRELLDRGRASFATNCLACHGEKGAGDGPGAAALNPKPRNFQRDPFKLGEKPEEVFKTLAAGVPSTPMVAFAHLPEAERWALTYWVLELRSGAGAGPVDAGAPRAPGAKKK